MLTRTSLVLAGSGEAPVIPRVVGKWQLSEQEKWEEHVSFPGS